MIFEVQDITPADYIRGKDGILRIDPKMKYRLHCHFAMSLSALASHSGWTMHLIHEQDGHYDFPGVSVYPPGQDGKSVLTSYRIEGGLPDELDESAEGKPYVGRTFTLVKAQQRSVAGPLDFHLPALLREKVTGRFHAEGEPGAYDPAEWARLIMTLCISIYEHQEALDEIDRKYSSVNVR